jgi:hypothetical protein
MNAEELCQAIERLYATQPLLQQAVAALRAGAAAEAELQRVRERINSPAIQGLRALCVKIAAEDERYPEADMNLDLAQGLCDHTPEIIALLDEMQRTGGSAPGR